jgi:hypothetical protein
VREEDTGVRGTNYPLRVQTMRMRSGVLPDGAKAGLLYAVQGEKTMTGKPTRSVITCAESGCMNHIIYNPQEDSEVPLYCEKHRTKYGRHSATRSLKKPSTYCAVPVPKVVLKCHNKSCGATRCVDKEIWISGVPFFCLKCASGMSYHNDCGAL